MNEEFRPVDQSLVNLLEGFGVVLRKLYALPEFAGGMCALDGLHVEVDCAGARVGTDGGIARVGQGAGLSIAETGDIVFVSTEILLLGGPESVSCEWVGIEGGST